MTEGIDMGQRATAAEQVRLTASGVGRFCAQGAGGHPNCVVRCRIARAAEPHRSGHRLFDFEATRRAVESHDRGYLHMGQLA